ncbi:MAG TPA: winged helix-turn-helix domain-containing protein [Vicinamibacterales bacterium]|jgi:DNA-binding winged helix-turn-helix (wHTH) protein
MMRSGAGVYRFGPFELDSSRRRLVRDGEPVTVPARHLDILTFLASNAGRVVSKDALITAGWNDVAVSDNSIEQAISSLRRTLGNQPGGAAYIETLARQGYRFAAPVERKAARESDAALDAMLAPYRAFVDGRAALETLDRDAVTRARDAFAQALRAQPEYSSAHIGMANACVLGFEATRADEAPDVDALQLAGHHAREGCRLDPASGEAWSTLAFVLHRSGEAREAIAAARKAVTLDPDDWRHYLRLAFVSWGEERLRAARRVLTLYPRLALAYWFAATVFVARQAFDAALEELRPGCASQDAQRKQNGRFNAVGLHLLHGLVLAAQGADDSALDELASELAFEQEGQLYARECCANTWYALGAIRLRHGHRDEAAAAFHESLRRVPGHPLALVGLRAAASAALPPRAPRQDGNAVDVAVVRAVARALQGDHAGAAQLCAEALTHAEPGAAGWIVPVDPLLHAAAHRDVWAETLSILRDRAS